MYEMFPSLNLFNLLSLTHLLIHILIRNHFQIITLNVTATRFKTIHDLLLYRSSHASLLIPITFTLSNLMPTDPPYPVLCNHHFVFYGIKPARMCRQMEVFQPKVCITDNRMTKYLLDSLDIIVRSQLQAMHNLVNHMMFLKNHLPASMNLSRNLLFWYYQTY